MARTTLRQKLMIETLESREVLSAGGPSMEAQYLLERINEARTSPAQYAEWVAQKADSDVKANLQHYRVDLNQVKAAIASAPSRQPLAWNARLAAAAQAHSEDQARGGFQSHTGSNGSDLDRRLEQAGYTDRAHSSENSFAYAKSLDNAMQAFMIDWGVADAGHRRNILQPDANDDTEASEVGIGIARSERVGFGPMVVTQNFGRQRGSKAQLLGVVYDDRDGDGRYSLGEGRGDVTIEIKNLRTGAVQQLETWDAGGYQKPLEAGSYQVTARSGDRVLGSKQVNLGNKNVKIDFTFSNARPAEPEPSVPVTQPVVSVPKVEIKSLVPTQAPVAAPSENGGDPADSESVRLQITKADLSSAGFDAGFSINWSRSWKAK